MFTIITTSSDCDTLVLSLLVLQVTDRIAPEYSKYVKTPMCLNMMKSKLKSFAYDSLQAFDKDAQLLFDNCILYNGEGSYFGVVGFNSLFSSLFA